MVTTLRAMCGLDCEECGFRQSHNCPGCVSAQGKIFWGECKIAGCCNGKELEHCGHCDTFPCEDLKIFAHDETHGDPEGSRILNLKKRLEEKV